MAIKVERTVDKDGIIRLSAKGYTIGVSPAEIHVGPLTHEPERLVHNIFHVRAQIAVLKAAERELRVLRAAVGVFDE